MSDKFSISTEGDGIDRRGFLKCMAWAGTGVLWVVSGGVMKSYGLGKILENSTKEIAVAELSFVQISDSHIGFNKEANPDVVATLETAIAKINAVPNTPSFMIHTGDLTHLSKPDEFDTVDQILRTAKPKTKFFVPGEHDTMMDNGKQYLDRYGKGTKGTGWYSFDAKGVHFIALINVMNFKPGGMGNLGSDQIEWLEDDVRHLSSSTPIVVFAHMPLWTIYPSWGWGTDDSAQALSYLKRFGSVTVLNGHIHQTMQKIEGNITFHTAKSTAFPQPAPGTAPAPGPMKVPASQLKQLLGLTSLNYMQGNNSLAIIDTPLASLTDMNMDSGQQDTTGKQSGESSQTKGNQVSIEDYAFNPKTIMVSAGTTVTWINKDDDIHTVTNVDKKFSSGALDTNEKFSFTFSDTGTFEYYCTMHPNMIGKVIVK